MAWEKRHNNWYFYRRVQRDGKSVRIYLGKDESAKKFAEHLEEMKRQREVNKIVDEVMEWLTGPILKLDQCTDSLTKATLTDEGYELHCRGEWRRKRNGKKPENET